MGACGLSREPRDANLDSGLGPLDGGLGDAGFADASQVDATVRDAGQVDATVLDATVLDAGPSDAGLEDAGSVDSGDTCTPMGPERCGTRDDEDCDGIIDEGTDAIGSTRFFRDLDGDGHGDPETSVQRCTAGMGYVRDNLDCDDRRSSVNPEAREVCGGLDEDCDGTVDEGDVCPCEAGSEFDGVTYRYCRALRTWEQARGICEVAGGILLGEHDSDVRSHIAEGMRAVTPDDPIVRPSRYWIGASDIVSEGSFVWTDRRAVMESHWSTNQPGDDGDARDCVAVWFRSGAWEDLDCGSARGAICAFPMPEEDAP